MRLPYFLLLLPLAVGCWPEDHHSQMVPETPFNGPAPVPQPAATTVSFHPANAEVAVRVDTLGRNLLAANPQLGIRPMFQTIGVPQLEVFHRGTNELFITEGMVMSCKTEGQLAAVLCTELGKMIAEREALAPPTIRVGAPGPPPDVPITHDTGVDQTRLAELAKFETSRQARPTSLPPPDPLTLARLYLKNAHFASTELDAVTPLLKTAAGQGAYEKQIVGSSAPRPMVR